MAGFAGKVREVIPVAQRTEIPATIHQLESAFLALGALGGLIAASAGIAVTGTAYAIAFPIYYLREGACDALVNALKAILVVARLTFETSVVV